MLQMMGPWVPTFKNCVDSEQLDFITFSFATVDQNGRPKVRTCVYRGFLFNKSATNVLTFTTDKRMLKLQELNNDCKFEACFYFPKSKKQFRFSGVAKVINNDITPSIILPSQMQVNTVLSSSSSPILKKSLSNNIDESIIPNIFNNLDDTNQSTKLNDPLVYPLVSPAMVTKYSSTNIDEDIEEILTSPTEQEWQSELSRQWGQLSRTMKSSFRKPTPGSLINSEKRVLIDAISRRVDGGKDEFGFENFSIICMFVDVVDFVDLDNLDNRRFISSRVKSDHWSEVEVCP